MTAAYSPLTLAELYGLRVPEIEYAVQDLLPMGSAALLSAREKSGKGLFTIDLCACIALEEPFLERSVRGGVAVYCAAEENVRTVRDRVRTRVGDRTDAPFHVLRLDGSTADVLDLERPETLLQLDNMMTELGPTVVVLDTLREIHNGRENDSDDMAPLLRPVRQLAHKHRALIVVNHHMSRAGNARGSTAIPASFDQVLEFDRDDGPGTDDTITGTLRVQGRDVRRQALKIALGDGNRWRINQVAATFPEDGTRGRILALIVRRPAGCTADEIADALGVKKGTVQNLLSQMRRESPPLIVGDGAGHKGSPFRYRAVQPEIHHHDGSPLGGEDVMNESGMPHDPAGTNGANRHDESGDRRSYGCGGCRQQVPWGEYCPRCKPAGGFGRAA